VSTVSHSVERILLDGLSEASAQIVREVEAETTSIYDHAVRYWPVRTGRSRASLGMQVEIDGEGVHGRVRAARESARYIQSAQIAIGLPDERRQRMMHRSARNAEQHRMVATVRGAGPDLLAYYSGEAGVKTGSKAARSGSAMWLLLRWPEAAAGRRLTESLGPLIEAQMQSEVP